MRYLTTPIVNVGPMLILIYLHVPKNMKNYFRKSINNMREEKYVYLNIFK